MGRKVGLCVASMVSMYNSGYGTVAIAKHLGVHRATVQRHLALSGILLRKTSPYTRYNVDFFNTLNERSAYWAGFIAADGCIRSDRDCLEIKLASVDAEHLLKFARCIGFGDVGKVKHYDHYSSISVAGRWFPGSLRRVYGLTPRKTFSVVMPDLDADLMRHYVRGYFDGDGSVSWSTCPTASFSTGSVAMINGLVDYIYSLGIRTKSRRYERLPVQMVSTNGYSISLSGTNALTFLGCLYEPSDHMARLDRKYDKYLGYLSLRGKPHTF